MLMIATAVGLRHCHRALVKSCGVVCFIEMEILWKSFFSFHFCERLNIETHATCHFRLKQVKSRI